MVTGKRIRDIRIALGLTQYEVARRMGLCQQHISIYENKDVITDNMANRFSAALGVSVEELDSDNQITSVQIKKTGKKKVILPANELLNYMEELTMEQRGILWTSILEFCTLGNEPNFDDAALKIVWKLIKQSCPGLLSV